MGFSTNYKNLKDKFSINLLPLPFHPQILDQGMEILDECSKTFSFSDISEVESNFNIETETLR